MHQRRLAEARGRRGACWRSALTEDESEPCQRQPRAQRSPLHHAHPELYPSRLSVDVAGEDARVSLALHGELDLETAPHFRERLADAEQGAVTVVIDLRGVTVVDSCGIGELVGAHQRTLAKLDETLETTADPAELSR